MANLPEKENVLVVGRALAMERVVRRNGQRHVGQRDHPWRPGKAQRLVLRHFGRKRLLAAGDDRLPLVILGLLVLGLGEGTMLALLFNVLVSASPKELAGDVGALRGVANSVSTALGAAFAGVLAVWLLSAAIHSSFARSDLPPRLKTENRTTRHASSFFL